MIHSEYVKRLNVIGRGLIPFLIISFCFIILGLHAFQAGQEFQVNTYTDNRQDYPAVAMDKKGNFAITWKTETDDASESLIYAKIFKK